MIFVNRGPYKPDYMEPATFREPAEEDYASSRSRCD